MREAREIVLTINGYLWTLIKVQDRKIFGLPEPSVFGFTGYALKSCKKLVQSVPPCSSDQDK